MAMHSARGQASVDTDPVKLSKPFTFSLSPQQDHAVSEVVKKIELHDETQRKTDLETANSPVFSKALDLLRYVPIKLSKSDGDDFFLPTYLTPGYRDVSSKVSLFDTR